MGSKRPIAPHQHHIARFDHNVRPNGPTLVCVKQQSTPVIPFRRTSPPWTTPDWALFRFHRRCCSLPPASSDWACSAGADSGSLLKHRMVTSLSRTKIMPYLALALIALGGWFKAAAAYQLHGYAWADQTCFRMRFFCTNSNLVLLIAIVAATIAVTIEFFRSRSY